jgi:hypothetical protein
MSGLMRPMGTALSSEQPRRVCAGTFAQSKDDSTPLNEAPEINTKTPNPINDAATYGCYPSPFIRTGLEQLCLKGRYEKTIREAGRA